MTEPKTDDRRPTTDPPATPPSIPGNSVVTPTDQQQRPEVIPFERFTQVNERAKALEKELADIKAADKKRKDADLSELERWQKTAADNETALKAERLNNAKLRVAQQKGLPADLVDFLTGDTEDAIMATADKLMQFLAKPAAPGMPPSRGNQPARLDINSMTPEEIRKNKTALYKQAGIG